MSDDYDYEATDRAQRLAEARRDQATNHADELAAIRERAKRQPIVWESDAEWVTQTQADICVLLARLDEAGTELQTLRLALDARHIIWAQDRQTIANLRALLDKVRAYLATLPERTPPIERLITAIVEQIGRAPNTARIDELP